MGQKISKSNTDSLNWDKINTESMSSAVPNLANINRDAETLISKLNIDNKINLEETESENENMFTWIKNTEEKKPEVEVNDENFSDTSPFISSDMYKYLIENNSSVTSEQKINQEGGAGDSSTSSTSSSPKKKVSKKSNSKKAKKVISEKFTESSSVMSGGDLSYISSSAHTENKSSELEETSISVQNNTMLSSSVNTSDINYISNDSD